LVLVAFVAVDAVDAAPAWSGSDATSPLPESPKPDEGPPIGIFAGLRPLTVLTVPPIPGARFAVFGREFVANEEGTARTVITKTERAELDRDRDAHLTVIAPDYDLATGTRARFAGWYDRGYRFSRADWTGDVRVAAFDVDHLTSFSFVDPAGDVVDPGRVALLELTSETGARFVTDPRNPVWLRGTEVTSRGDDFDVRDIEYRVSKVSVLGTNVVNRDQQRFFPSQRHHVAVHASFHTVTFRTRDAFLGSDAGRALDLEYPDGSRRRFDLQRGTVTVDGLPRGGYRMTVIGPGPRMSRALTVSRDQTVDVKVLSWLDVGSVAGTLFVVSAGLMLIGYSRRRRRRRQQPVPRRDPARSADPLLA
jgi:hypothetical protein